MRIREAVESDLEAIIGLLADDEIGREREDCTRPVPECYTRAFAEIASDPNNSLYAVCDDEGSVIGCFQLSFTRYLSHKGSLRATLENVRIASALRGRGLGTELLRFVVDTARERGAAQIQLTSSKSRLASHRFYTRFGFQNTHEGFKLDI